MLDDHLLAAAEEQALQNCQNDQRDDTGEGGHGGVFFPNQARRDQNRFDVHTSGSAYRQAMHQAVMACKGNDVYTGENLDWSLISQYNNEESKAGRHEYKGRFALLPTVDHVDASCPTSALCICAWRTNDSKHDMSTSEFLHLCEKVLVHSGRQVT